MKKVVAVATPILLGLALVSYFFFDIPLAAFFHVFSRAVLRPASSYIAVLGQAQWYIVPGIVLFLVWRKSRPKNARLALYLLASVTTAGIVVDILRFLLGRYRPELLWKDDLYGFRFLSVRHEYLSFPSGHATIAIASAVALGQIFPRFRWGFYLIGLLICVSRVVGTQHYLSDVLAGAWLGMVTALCWRKYLFDTAGQVAGNGPA